MNDQKEEYREIIGGHEALTLVGRVASSWAILEWCLDATIWWLADVEEPEGACITGQFGSTNQRMKALIALAKLRGHKDGVVKKLNKFGKDCEGVGRLRNRAIHDPWYAGLTSEALAQHKITADKELKMEMAPRSLDDLRAIVSQIDALRNRFSRLMEDELDFPVSE